MESQPFLYQEDFWQIAEYAGIKMCLNSSAFQDDIWKWLQNAGHAEMPAELEQMLLSREKELEHDCKYTGRSGAS